jgi:hypothetical protein
VRGTASAAGMARPAQNPPIDEVRLKLQDAGGGGIRFRDPAEPGEGRRQQHVR